MLAQRLKMTLRAYWPGGVIVGIGGLLLQKFRKKVVVDVSNEYVGWLRHVNAGMLQSGNLYCFDYAIRNLPNAAPILEIGSFCGLSTNLLTYYKEKHGVRNLLFTCDRWEFPRSEGRTMVGDSSITHAEYRAYARETFIRNVHMFSRYDLPHTIEMLSDEFFAAWRNGQEVADVFGGPVRLGGPLSFCYIDGNHSYEYARRDFINCDELLVPGGFILFDDSMDFTGYEGVRRVVAEVRRSGRYELVIKNPNYFFRKK